MYISATRDGFPRQQTLLYRDQAPAESHLDAVLSKIGPAVLRLKWSWPPNDTKRSLDDCWSP